MTAASLMSQPQMNKALRGENPRVPTTYHIPITWYNEEPQLSARVEIPNERCSKNVEDT